jgi:hypothetical protein
MSLTDKLTAEKAGLESYLDSERGAKLEQSQIDRLDTLNSLLAGDGGGSGSITSNDSIEYGAGASTAKTQRVAIATNANSVVLGTGDNVIGAITNTAFTANAGINLNTSALALTANQIPAFSLSTINLGAANAATVKASAGAVYSLKVTNKNASVRYFQIINKATTPTNSDSALIVDAIALPSNATVIIDSSYFGATGLVCATGISWAFSSTDTTTTLATASDVISTVGWL